MIREYFSDKIDIFLARWIPFFMYYIKFHNIKKLFFFRQGEVPKYCSVHGAKDPTSGSHSRYSISQIKPVLF